MLNKTVSPQDSGFSFSYSRVGPRPASKGCGDDSPAVETGFVRTQSGTRTFTVHHNPSETTEEEKTTLRERN